MERQRHTYAFTFITNKIRKSINPVYRYTCAVATTSNYIEFILSYSHHIAAKKTSFDKESGTKRQIEIHASLEEKNV